MTIFELGAIGEFTGAILLFLSLIYVGIQIRQNTNSMDESRRLALAQTRLAAADSYAEHQREFAESVHLAPIHQKLMEAGWPATAEESFRNLTGIERMRYAGWNLGYASNADNWFYQYQQGFLPQDHYETRITGIIKNLGPIWQALGILGGLRPDFQSEVARILALEKN